MSLQMPARTQYYETIRSLLPDGAAAQATEEMFQTPLGETDGFDSALLVETLIVTEELFGIEMPENLRFHEMSVSAIYDIAIELAVARDIS